MRLAYAALLVLTVSCCAHAAPIPATEDGKLGLYDAGDFHIEDGACIDCNALPQALWYFRGDLVALPLAKAAGFYKSMPAQQDVAAWAASAPDLDERPPLIWLGSGKVIADAALSADGKRLVAADDSTLDFAIVPRIPTNLSYWNDSTLKFFARRHVRLRGETADGTFVARSIWPLDYRIAPDAPAAPLANSAAGSETVKTLVQYERGGARSAYQSRLLWQREPGAAQRSPGKAVIALMLNGAQGDDDEAHAGHFAVVTGRFEADGSYARWLVNNFYNLDAYSEKGIVAAITPLDKYLADLNSGQSYYRPSYMLVASFSDDAPAALYQAAVGRVYNHFYRHDFVFDLSRDNCTGMSMDTFRTLGWRVPQRGVEGRFKAIAAYLYESAGERSLQKGRKIYDYLSTETTRLYPAVAFDAMGNDLLALAQGHSGRELTPLERDMAQHIQAIWFVRIPQIPSSRAFGMAPVYSFDQYMQQAPADRSKWKIIPTTPRPFPDQLRDGLALQQPAPALIPVPVAVTVFALLALLLWLALRIRRCWTAFCRLSGWQ